VNLPRRPRPNNAGHAFMQNLDAPGLDIGQQGGIEQLAVDNEFRIHAALVATPEGPAPDLRPYSVERPGEPQRFKRLHGAVGETLDGGLPARGGDQ